MAGLYRPDLVLMDIILDGEIGGIEAAERIKSRFRIPIVYISSSADRKTLERAKLTEPLGFIIKPFDEKTLQTTVDIALYKSKTDKILSKGPGIQVHRRPQREHSLFKSSQAGLQQGWTRATFIVQTDLLEKIKALAYWERRSIKEVIDEALEIYLKDKEIVPIEK
jgi:CheY-like chemotaxis protein